MLPAFILWDSIKNTYTEINPIELKQESISSENLVIIGLII